MVGASRWEGVRPLRKVLSEEGTGEGKVYDARAPNERHGEPGKYARHVKETEPQFCGPVKVGGRRIDLVLLEDPKGVCRGVVNVQVTQRESGEGGRGKNNIRGNRAGVVETTLRAVRVDDREASRGGVEKTVRGEEVQCHNITPSEEAGQEGNSIQKKAVNVKSNAGFAAPVSGRGKHSEQIKGRKLAPVDRRVLQGNNGRRKGQLRE